ncbi:hypothetical protein BLA29_002076 [Euroglyphus maynei]|uniref:Uncharacterized protein n=1 Tax=Euroglyphus maynei TaxID=6958 RepID=A0A1Y3AQD1_EURMA|nr:hypothetical protein BLA29_002076 [Euroglyphus maynei]
MLYWFYQAKSLELRVGKTTSTSLVFAIYPLLFLLLLAITLLHLPYCIDWIFGHASTAINDKANMLNIAMRNISTVYLEDCLLLLLLTMLMAMFHSNPLDLHARLRSYHSNRTLEMLNILLLIMAFITIIIGSLIWESMRMTITIVLTLITIGHFRHHLWNRINHFNHHHHHEQMENNANIVNYDKNLFKSE